MWQENPPSTLPKAVVFVGFHHKEQGLKGVKKFGFKSILITHKYPSQAQGFFDEVIEGDIASALFLQECANFLKKHYQVKAVLSNYEHYVVLRSYLAEKLGVPTAALRAVASSRNKALQRQALKDLPFNIDFRIISTLPEAEQAFKDLGGDVFLKSIAGIKSRLVFHVQNKDELVKAFAQFQSINPEVQQNLYHNYSDYDNLDYPDPTKVFLIEKAEYGQQVTVSSFAGESEIVYTPSLCDIYPASHLGRSDSFLAFRILPSRFEPAIVSGVTLAAEQAVKATNLKHCTLFFDFMVTREGEIKLIELASRMGGYRPLMYQAAYGLDLNELFLKNAMGETIGIDPKLEAKRHVSLIEIFPEKEGILESIEGMQELEKDSRVSALRIVKKKGDPVGLAKNGFEQCLSFLIEGGTYQEVYDLSMEYCKKLKVHLV